MDKKAYLVKFLNRNNDVVYQFVVKTCKIIRTLDVCRGWLAGNNWKYNERVVDSIECEIIDETEVNY